MQFSSVYWKQIKPTHWYTAISGGFFVIHRSPLNSSFQTKQVHCEYLRTYLFESGVRASGAVYHSREKITIQGTTSIYLPVQFFSQYCNISFWFLLSTSNISFFTLLEQNLASVTNMVKFWLAKGAQHNHHFRNEVHRFRFPNITVLSVDIYSGLVLLFSEPS